MKMKILFEAEQKAYFVEYKGDMWGYKDFLAMKFKLCGCIDDEVLYDIEDILKLIYDLLEHSGGGVACEEVSKKLNLPEKYVLLIFGMLDNLGYITHGGNIMCAMQEKKGLSLVKFMRTKDKLEQDNNK